MYEEEAVLPLFTQRLRPVLDGLEARSGATYEVVAVDDGSNDATPVLLERARRDWPQLRVVRLRTNAGHQAALSAGVAGGRGAAVCARADPAASSRSAAAIIDTLDIRLAPWNGVTGW